MEEGLTCNFHPGGQILSPGPWAKLDLCGLNNLLTSLLEIQNTSALLHSAYWFIFLCLFPCQSHRWSLSKLIKVLICLSLTFSQSVPRCFLPSAPLSHLLDLLLLIFAFFPLSTNVRSSWAAQFGFFSAGSVCCTWRRLLMRCMNFFQITFQNAQVSIGIEARSCKVFLSLCGCVWISTHAAWCLSRCPQGSVFTPTQSQNHDPNHSITYAASKTSLCFRVARVRRARALFNCSHLRLDGKSGESWPENIIM